MKTYAILIFLIPMLVSNCRKDEKLNTEPPNLSETILFDLNGDGINDIKFEYVADDVVTDGTVGYVGYVEPMNGGLLWVSTKNEDSWIFDIRPNDTIRKGESSLFNWYPSNLGFISIDDSPEGFWPNEWSVSGTITSNPYYLGIQVRENDSFFIGWLKLEIDKKTGDISLLDFRLSPEDFIVVDK